MKTPSALIPPASAQRDLANLDLLRAFAVLLVFFGNLARFHGMNYLGPLSLDLVGPGVLLFYVHTYFVLMQSLERQWNDRGSAKLFTVFMIRRSFRILPLSMLAVALVVIFRLPLMSLEPHHFYGVVHPSSSLVLLNLLLVQDLTRSVNILEPLWSLPLEMQMYLFLPGLFLFIRPARSIWRLVILWAIAVGFGAMTLHSEGITSVVRAFALFLPGAIAYQIQRKKISMLPAFLWPVLIAALTILFLAAADRGGVGGLLAREYCVCLLLGLLMPRFRQISTDWLVVPSHAIAKYSYGIYLTQFFTIWLALEEMSHLPKIIRLGTLIVLGAGLPVFFYHVIEEPMIRFGKRLVDRPVTSTVPSKKPRFVQPNPAEN
jgi:peptidoglycan/LPS O-acetylase OafA/YrhL